MADPLSIASGVIAVVTAAIQTSKALYDTIDSYKSFPRRVVELRNQLRALIDVLESLRELTQVDNTACLPLKFPLEQCCLACQEFKALLESSTTRSGKRYPSFTDWMKLSFRNGDVISFTESLAGYKLTISIAIGDANLRTSTVTLKVLEDYKNEVASTSQHLKSHLDEIKSRLESLTQQNVEQPVVEFTSLKGITDEKSSTEACLQLCRRFQADIDKMQFQLVSVNDSAAPGRSTSLVHKDISMANVITISTLNTCKEEIGEAMSKLLIHQEKTENKLKAETTRQLYQQEHGSDLQLERLQKDVDSANQLLDFCKGAEQRATPERVHVLENIAVGNSAQQFCVSTVGDLFKVRGASAGDNSFQFFGSTSNETLQQVVALQNRRRHDLNMKIALHDVYSGSSGNGSSRTTQRY